MRGIGTVTSTLLCWQDAAAVYPLSPRQWPKRSTIVLKPDSVAARWCRGSDRFWSNPKRSWAIAATTKSPLCSDTTRSAAPARPPAAQRANRKATTTSIFPNQPTGAETRIKANQTATGRIGSSIGEPIILLERIKGNILASSTLWWFGNCDWLDLEIFSRIKRYSLAVLPGYIAMYSRR